MTIKCNTKVQNCCCLIKQQFFYGFVVMTTGFVSFVYNSCEWETPYSFALSPYVSLHGVFIELAN